MFDRWCSIGCVCIQVRGFHLVLRIILKLANQSRRALAGRNPKPFPASAFGALGLGSQSEHVQPVESPNIDVLAPSNKARSPAPSFFVPFVAMPGAPSFVASDGSIRRLIYTTSKHCY